MTFACLFVCLCFQKRGPLRSVDMIVSDGFLIEVFLVGVMCFSVSTEYCLSNLLILLYRHKSNSDLSVESYSVVQLLQVGDSFMEDLLNWDATLAAAAIGIFLLRFMTVGLQIDKKFKNLSILITEQVRAHKQVMQLVKVYYKMVECSSDLRML